MSAFVAIPAEVPKLPVSLHLGTSLFGGDMGTFDTAETFTCSQ